MAKKMLIDATHAEEQRVAIMDGNRLEGFEAETSTKQKFKGNIYLAKVIRVEPSLQAAFVEFGNNRHGFLPFSEIHPDYYRLPTSERRPLEEPSPLPAEDSANNSIKNEEKGINEIIPSSMSEGIGEESTEIGEEEEGFIPRPKVYQYKIQEVIKRRQIMLIQVVKEERGNKGAALTTYLSLPGRYCVLMPNAGHRSGGISRKITDSEDRKRLREILNDLPIPDGISLIVRTAGIDRNKLEIRRDFEYLLRLWNEIRETTLKSIAPQLIYAEGDLIKRTLRDNYGKEIEEILVEGEEGYKAAKAFMKTLMPSHAKKIKLYKAKAPLFHHYGVEAQIDAIMNPIAVLPSGGSIVINPTEALVAVDVNSGKSTKERHIDETAVKTNLEAADEIARQMRLRDLAGLIVIDFIDMNDNKHIQAVEKRLKDAISQDRARIQIGRISQFGLLELSRQRLRPSIIETNMKTCSHCKGIGVVRSLESMALHVLRAIETAGIEGTSAEIRVTVPPEVDLYLLNHKRSMLTNIEKRYDFFAHIYHDAALSIPEFHIEILRPKNVLAATEEKVIDLHSSMDKPLLVSSLPASPLEEEAVEEKTGPAKERGRKRSRLFNNRRRSNGSKPILDEKTHPTDKEKEEKFPEEPFQEVTLETPTSPESSEKPVKKEARRRRQRRHHRRQKGGEETEKSPQTVFEENPVILPLPSAEPPSSLSVETQEKKKRRWWKRLLDA